MIKTVPRGDWLRLAGLALLALMAAVTPADAHGIPPAEIQRLMTGGPLAYLRSGAIHMITGYDHLLFLFGVMFFLTRFGQIAKFVTVFTIGHSITLLSATLLGVKANYFLVDAVIAISVIYKGFDNLEGFPKVLGLKAPNLLLMVFGFGLIHGFGLSTRLQKLPLPLPKEGLVERILAFNVGVELGQLAALVVMVAILAVARRFKGFPIFSRIANLGLVIAGSLLFLMQMHGYLHTRYPDNFGFSSDLHSHDHRKMEEKREQSRDNLLAPGDLIPGAAGPAPGVPK